MEHNTTNKEALIAELEQARKRIVMLEEQQDLTRPTVSPQLAEKISNLSRSADYLRCLIRSIPDLVWLKDPNGVYLTCNPSFETFFGAKEAEIVGKTDYDFVSRELADSFLEHDRIAMQAGKPSVNEEWLTFSDNGYRGLFETIKTPMLDGQGNLIGVLGIARDITDRKRTVIQLIEMKDKAEAANRVKSEFLANMSHEIRTPLNGALSMLQLLENTTLTSEQTEYLQAAITSARRLTRLLSDILDISRIEAGKFRIEEAEFQVESLRSAILELFSQAAKDRGNSLTFTWLNELPVTLIGDEARLRQILFNLVGNAIKFTENGKVKVELEFIPSRHEEIVMMVIAVHDTGIGITDEQIKEIFEPFVQAEGTYTRRFQGAGLGLSIVRKLVHLMDGEVAIDNGNEEGTIVYVSLPFKIPAQILENAGQQAQGTNHGRKISGLKILLVEDEEISSMAARLMLELEGHTVVTAQNGLEAVQRLSGEKFDLIFMDIQMPLMDGVEATRKIRGSKELGRKAEVPIIAMTAYTMIGDKESFLAAGMDGYVAKPISRDEIATVIAKVLTQRQEPEVGNG
ncbi:ATP-binding protein [Desulfopila aestuarii]|uniref:Sensory/regulatory protein RpfC n=1 Tax=Desulfopila aestuarii DSM 18488 TaxID=1121416 RepID=A0A1M7YI13_9BACT|nr:ATP-binding protein [Desulfopila aestuarii]SHO52264.1 PAS domain S-box-containing protein [Desulfopila aestuarii DSM 18488]